MASDNNSKIIYNVKEPKDNKKTAKVVIITSVDGDDDDKILSCLNPSNIETFVVDLNNTNLIDACQFSNKRSLSQSVGFYLKIINKIKILFF
jgi:hypothetical protein